MLYPVKYWLWSLYKWWHGSWVVHDLFRVQSEAMRVSPDQIWTARLLGWVIMISPCHALVTSHQDTETQEKTDPEVKFVWRHNLAQPAVCCGIKLSQKVLIDPGDWVFVSWYRHEIGGLRNPHQSQQQQPSLVMKCSVPTGTIPGHLYWSAQ